MRWTRKLRPSPIIVSLFLWLAGSTLAGVAAAALINRVRRGDILSEMDARSRVAIAHLRRTLSVARDRNSPSDINQSIDDLLSSGATAAAVCVPSLAPFAAATPAPCNDPIVSRALVRDSVGTLVTAASFNGSDARYVAALAVPDDRPEVVLVVSHSLAYLAAREDATRRGALLVSWLFALVVFGYTHASTRLTRRRLLNQVRRLLGLNPPSTDFAPLPADLRELARHLAMETELELAEGTWSAARLRSTVNQFLGGSPLIVVANREPYVHVRDDDGHVRLLHPASGLVTAVEPVVRACAGTWIAHGAGSADRETADRNARLRVPPPPEDPAYWLRRIWLSREEEQGYYYGFANEGLWPLCHLAHTRPIFRASDFAAYRTVNRRFANAVVEEASTRDPIVFVQDYHFALAPRMIRERLPDATIVTFWHIPWPNAEKLGICPFRNEILHGLLGSSILGFHTQYHCSHFFECVDRYLEARVTREEQAVVTRGRVTRVRAYPISVAWPEDDTKWPSIADCRRSLRSQLALGNDSLIGVGVDRLDYTKGIEERFLAVERLLETHPDFIGRFAFLQLAAPSRTAIEEYSHANERVVALAARINERFGKGEYRPIHLRLEHHEHDTINVAYRGSDCCYVSSLHDGMNLVAKEFIAARTDEQGVLVLSQFTGASRELTDALIVNPYDLEQASAALFTAITMPAREQRERMRALRAHVRQHNVFRWAGRMLMDAAAFRRREQSQEFPALRRADAASLM
ncbi:MAG TPA: trehalose-6-phosphate synthase [Gemmatimonadaceae bacterium]|nr:trehalose-6-phosphate synthase [Gemmatimonadaceae bacterium]